MSFFSFFFFLRFTFPYGHTLYLTALHLTWLCDRFTICQVQRPGRIQQCPHVLQPRVIHRSVKNKPLLHMAQGTHHPRNPLLLRGLAREEIRHGVARQSGVSKPFGHHAVYPDTVIRLLSSKQLLRHQLAKGIT